MALERSERGRKTEIFNHSNRQEIFAFASIYSTWINAQTNETLKTYSIITTDANELMAEIHNNKKRMPVVLKQKDHQAWLNGTDHSKFAFPYEVPLIASEVV